jgi:hypothetical protein
LPEPHWVLLVQALHPDDVQIWSPQFCAVPGRQVPEPLQVPAGVNEPPLQEALPQLVLDAR